MPSPSRTGRGRPSAAAFMCLLAAVALLMVGCGPSADASPTPDTTATGVVVRIERAAGGDVSGFILRTPSGERLTFTIGPLDLRGGFPADHLAEHQVTAEQVRVDYRTADGGRVALRLTDAGSPTPSSAAPGGSSAPPAASSAPPTPSSGSPAAPSGSPAAPSGSPAESSTPPPAGSLALEPFAEGLDAPVFVTHAGDGSGLLYAVEQGGRIRVIEPDGTLRDRAFLDIGDRIVAGGEQGLLGLAFHPEYEQNGRFFVMYTAAGDGANTIAEFRARDGTSDPTSERVLVAIDDFAGNHNGGMVAFGSDGHLYAGTGDGGGGGDPRSNGQRLDALLGKILRIDVDGGDPYAIPSDNPFRDRTDARPEIWALGLRNPWRFSFDRETGDLWIGDVGQGSFEEVDAEPAGDGGRNYGWNVMEGPACFADDPCDTEGLTLPVASYGRDGGDCTVVGGYVYRGAAHPGLQGTYLLGDYCSGRIRALPAAEAFSAGSAAMTDVGRAEGSISAFGEDEAGELYLVELDGRISRIGLAPRP